MQALPPANGIPACGEQAGGPASLTPRSHWRDAEPPAHLPTSPPAEVPYDDEDRFVEVLKKAGLTGDDA